MLFDMDNLPRADNPLNSAQRLQVSVSKCRNHEKHIAWVLEHIRHMVCVPVVEKPVCAKLTVDALRGNYNTCNRRLVDVILLNKEALGHFCFHRLTIQLGFHGDSEWLSEVRTPSM
ncbi:MAG: hypothetical protein ACKPKO_25360, partial [Candidatus Fonsibacter sp.]